MAPECYSSNLRARQVHGVDLNITSQCPGEHRIVLGCATAAQEHRWDSLGTAGAPTPALPAFTSTGCQRVFGGWREMKRAVPCRSAEKIQLKGQVSVKRCWYLGAAACCPAGRAVQGLWPLQRFGSAPFPAHHNLPCSCSLSTNPTSPPLTAPRLGEACSYLLPSWRGCIGRGGAGDVQGTRATAGRWWSSYPKTCMEQGMDLQATQRLGVLNADFSIRCHKVLKAWASFL